MTARGAGRPARRPIARTSNAPRVPFALLVGGLLVGGLVLLLALNTASAANELRRSALAGKDQEVSVDVAQLRNEVAASSAPGNLAAAAEQLGMVPAAHPAFIVELPNGRTVLRGHARPVSDDPLDIPTGTTHVSPSPTTRAALTATPTATATPTGTPTATPTGTPTATDHPKNQKHPSTKQHPTKQNHTTTKHPTHQKHPKRHRPGRAGHTAATTPNSTSSSTGGHA